MAINGTTTVATLRNIVAQAVLRNGSFDPTDAANVTRLDMAIKAAGDEWMLQCKSHKKVDTSLTLASDSYEVDITGITDFSPRRFMGAELNDTVAGHIIQSIGVDYDTLMEARLNWNANNAFAFIGQVPPQGIYNGRPSVCAFNHDMTRMLFYPKSDTAFQVRLHYWLPFVSWTYGSLVPPATTTVINIPDEFIFGFAQYAVPLKYDMVQASADYLRIAEPAYRRFISLCRQRLSGTILGVSGYSSGYGW